MRAFKALRTAVNVTNVQGDLFSRGFPKHYEIYYFFSINAKKNFPKALGNLMTKKYISNLGQVIHDWNDIDKANEEAKKNNKTAELLPMSHALIGFSKSGLDKIASDLKGVRKLGLEKLIKSDPSFNFGMKNPNMIDSLRDPDKDTWDDLFQEEIDGIIKVAGSDQQHAENKLHDIKEALGHGATTDAPIRDIKKLPSPTVQESRVDGEIRSKKKNLNGLEHFGFQDGISQPLLADVDKPTTLKANPFMVTDPNVIITAIGTPTSQNVAGVRGDPGERPPWMVDGSFLVFRKLEQSVKKFKALTSQPSLVGCKTDLEVGAKLMGRWQNGTPLMLNQDEPHEQKLKPDDLFAANNFKYGRGDADEHREHTRSLCPLAAHIRKTNPRLLRSGAQHLPDTEQRIIRNGIPYGSEYDEASNKADADSGRGLLFACYQSSIDRGFFFIQTQWANDPDFGSDDTTIHPGFDPIIGQQKSRKLETNLFDKDGKTLNKLGAFDQLVTMKGGEYFFVPSLFALSTVLSTTGTSSST